MLPLFQSLETASSLRACLQGERVTLVLGYPSKRVKVSSGLQANFTGRVTLSGGSTLPALLTCFVIRDILCTRPKVEIINNLYGKHVNFTKKCKNIIIVSRKYHTLLRFLLLSSEIG